MSKKAALLAGSQAVFYGREGKAVGKVRIVVVMKVGNDDIVDVVYGVSQAGKSC